MIHSRREFVKLAAASAMLTQQAWAAESTNKSYLHGVQLGVQTYSFHEIPTDGQNHIDWVIKDMLACGIYDCELFGGAIVPGLMTGRRPPVADCPAPLHGCPAGKGGTERNPFRWVFAQYTGDALKAARAHQKEWNETVSMDFFGDVRKKCNDAGINIYSYNILLPDDSSDLEIDRIFEAAQTLGVKALTLSPRMNIVRRLAPFAEKHQMMVTVHGHSMTWDPDEMSTTASFQRAMALSKWIGVNLDIGHFSSMGEDPISFIDQYHDRISNLHLKDRKRNTPSSKIEDGVTVPWGQGETPIKEVLLLLQKKRYNIPAFIEYEHAGTGSPVEEVTKAYQYCKDVLAKG
jgi:sugar phosphate isomerase/epimerase